MNHKQTKETTLHKYRTNQDTNKVSIWCVKKVIPSWIKKCQPLGVLICVTYQSDGQDESFSAHTFSKSKNNLQNMNKKNTERTM